MTREFYLQISNSENLLRLCNDIAAEQDADKRGELKKKLPVVTWQAYFPGKRISKEAQPSGLFMLDIDHVENPFQLYSEKVAGRTQELGIVYAGMTASRHGLRIVAKCLPTLHTIEECQRWLASNLKVEFDGVCKDWARCSFLVHDSYTYFMDAKVIWEDEPAEGTVYAVDNNMQTTIETNTATSSAKAELGPRQVKTDNVDQREGLFGGGDDYRGVPYETICKEWLESTGGEPQQGERNSRLYALAMRLRYITDFNEATMLRVMPRYGLSDKELHSIVKSALGATRAMRMPKDLEDVLHNIDRRAKVVGDETDLPDIITDTTKLPPLPPVFKQFVDNAPDDFKQAVLLCQLPILGALGSKLRAEYLDGRMHSPSFQVSLEAPQASGKSFMSRLAEYELAQMIAHDETQREKEQEYDKKVREMKLLNIKVNADNKEEILGSRPQSLIRYVPPTISITKLLMRMNDAQGLHLFCFCPEADTMTKAFKRGFSSLSDLLRLSFDNDKAGQDYASDSSFSGVVRMYYNLLMSGTPKAMRRFYPDVEDGLISRVCFVTLPDQFGKPMPQWVELNKEQKAIVDVGLVRLNEISIQGDEVQPDHVMKLNYLNKEMEKWIKAQQAEAVKNDDRTRDIFCRRAAVVGFRAGMLAHFLYGEKTTPTIMRHVRMFAQYVANSMLNQQLLRFNIQSTHSNTNQWEGPYSQLPDEFTREDAQRVLDAAGVDTPLRTVLYKWRLSGAIDTIQEGRSKNQKAAVKFKKTHSNQ